MAISARDAFVFEPKFPAQKLATQKTLQNKEKPSSTSEKMVKQKIADVWFYERIEVQWLPPKLSLYSKEEVFCNRLREHILANQNNLELLKKELGVIDYVNGNENLRKSLLKQQTAKKVLTEQVFNSLLTQLHPKITESTSSRTKFPPERLQKSTALIQRSPSKLSTQLAVITDEPEETAQIAESMHYDYEPQVGTTEEVNLKPQIAKLLIPARAKTKTPKVTQLTTATQALAQPETATTLKPISAKLQQTQTIALKRTWPQSAPIKRLEKPRYVAVADAILGYLLGRQNYTFGVVAHSLASYPLEITALNIHKKLYEQQPRQAPNLIMATPKPELQHAQVKSDVPRFAEEAKAPEKSLSEVATKWVNGIKNFASSIVNPGSLVPRLATASTAANGPVIGSYRSMLQSFDAMHEAKRRRETPSIIDKTIYEFKSPKCLEKPEEAFKQKIRGLLALYHKEIGENPMLQELAKVMKLFYDLAFNKADCKKTLETLDIYLSVIEEGFGYEDNYDPEKIDPLNIDSEIIPGSEESSLTQAMEAVEILAKLVAKIDANKKWEQNTPTARRYIDYCSNSKNYLQQLRCSMKYFALTQEENSAPEVVADETTKSSSSKFSSPKIDSPKPTSPGSERKPAPIKRHNQKSAVTPTKSSQGDSSPCQPQLLTQAPIRRHKNISAEDSATSTQSKSTNSTGPSRPQEMRAAPIRRHYPQPK